jgi:hypothetical protein
MIKETIPEKLLRRAIGILTNKLLSFFISGTVCFHRLGTEISQNDPLQQNSVYN